ncbi:hypothetical protein [Phascolarctobacterium faecium]|jgi:hypothetical protein|uniref:hypothetical protein n=1 Tax=Phascolarctobacterium faecium TaxID=33025 RepID=UPI003521F3FF
MSYSYNDYVGAFSDSFKRVKVEQDYANRISEFVKELIAAKAVEEHHQRDNLNEIKRFTTGYLGEAALEKLLGIQIIDWTIGYSGLYHHPDIPGYSVGIKTVEQGKFPIIFKENYYPQIICIRSSKIPNLIFVCGLATKDVLNTYQDTNLILDSNLRARGTKTGFYGFQHLKPFTSLNDIEKYKK